MRAGSSAEHVSERSRRFDLFAGRGRRWSFTAAEKAAVVEMSYAGGDSVRGVARRRGLTQHLFGWRRLARAEPFCSAAPPLFVPVIGTTEREAPTREEALARPKPCRRRLRGEEVSIEGEIGRLVVRVGRDADAGAIAAVIGALKTGS